MDFTKLFSRTGPGEDALTSTLWTTPWAYRTPDFVYVGHNGQVWLYRTLGLAPVEWEDPRTRLDAGDRVGLVLRELGRKSRAGIGGLSSTAEEREIHLIAHTWEAPAQPPKDNSTLLQEWQTSILQFTVPHKALFIGVRLRPGKGGNLGVQKKGVLSTLNGLAVRALAQEVPDIDQYQADSNDIGNVLSRLGARVPSREESMYLESWFNDGHGPDATQVEYADHITTAGSQIELSAIMAFGDMNLQAPYDQWAADLATHEDAPYMISVRAKLQPSSTARSRARKSQRRINDIIEEQRATGDLDRGEDSRLLEYAQMVEDRLVDGGDAILTECSLLIARKRKIADETYHDFLRNRFAIGCKPLEHRQMPALDETLPCSGKRVNPFLQDLDIDMIAFSGLHAFGEIGDRRGCYIGLGDPDLAATFIDPLGAPRASAPAATAILGDSGSGKTHLMQSLVLQAALDGKTCIVVNPKGYDTLESGLVDLPLTLGIKARVIKMSALESQPGAFDPFRYAPPAVAAEIAAGHILSVLEGGWTQSQRIKLSQGLKRAALVGVLSVGEALMYIEDETVKQDVLGLVEGSATFALGIALEARPPFSEDGGITLIEFDRKLPLPTPGKPERDYQQAEAIAVAAVRLVARASMEILNGAKAIGGVFALDEAWTFLGSQAGLDFLDALSREGRSQNIWPIFVTQRVSDVLAKADLGPYLSRVLALQMTSEADQEGALKLVGMEDTPYRRTWLKGCGPVEPDGDNPGRWPMALYRDLKNRHAAVLLGPTPLEARLAFSTTPEVRKAREDEAARLDEERRLVEETKARAAIRAAGLPLPPGQQPSNSQ